MNKVVIQICIHILNQSFIYYECLNYGKFIINRCIIRTTTPTTTTTTTTS